MENLEEVSAKEYDWYVQGCNHLGWLPLHKLEFLSLYGRLHQCEQIVEAYKAKSGDNAFWLQQGLKETIHISTMLTNVKAEINRLAGLDRAVMVGKRSDLDGGAGVAARLAPVPPSLAGGRAEPLPTNEDAEITST